MFFLCIFFPPLAALISGGFMSCILNIFLTLLGWIPGMIHAFMVVNDEKAEKRNQEQIKVIQEQTEAIKESQKSEDKPQVNE